MKLSKVPPRKVVATDYKVYKWLNKCQFDYISKCFDRPNRKCVNFFFYKGTTCLQSKTAVQFTRLTFLSNNKIKRRLNIW